MPCKLHAMSSVHLGQLMFDPTDSLPFPSKTLLKATSDCMADSLEVIVGASFNTTGFMIRPGVSL